jgi:hypothetical protein
MSNEAKNPLGAINLTEEIEIRRRLNAEFEQLLGVFSHGLTPENKEDLDVLAQLLIKVREEMKLLSSQETQLKQEIRRFFPEGSYVLDLPQSVVILEPCERSSLDQAALQRDLGGDFLSKYTKTTQYEVMRAKRK